MPKAIKVRPRIEIRTIRRYLDLFPEELGLRGTGKSSDQGPDFAIFNALVDEYWMVSLRKLFRTIAPDDLGGPWGSFVIAGEDGQDLAIGLYRRENRL